MDKTYSFDTIAFSYVSNTKPIPDSYIKLIADTVKIRKEDRVLDIGCGSGEMAIRLSNHSDYVEGVDISKRMIELAKSADRYNRVIWHTNDIDSFELGKNRFKLVISYETFHLLNSDIRLLSKIWDSLIPEGYLCVGYCVYNWEWSLYKDILRILNSNGIILDDWFIQKALGSLNDFYLTITGASHKTINETFVDSNEIWTANEITDYILSTSIFLNKDVNKEKVKKELHNMIIDKYEKNSGASRYYLRYIKKRVPCSDIAKL